MRKLQKGRHIYWSVRLSSIIRARNGVHVRKMPVRGVAPRLVEGVRVQPMRAWRGRSGRVLVIRRGRSGGVLLDMRRRPSQRRVFMTERQLRRLDLDLQ